MDSGTLGWLLEENNPGVRLRALTDILGLPRDHPDVTEARTLVVETLPSAHDLSWLDAKGLAPIYGLTALAECGLTSDDLPIGPAADRVLSQSFDAACGDMMGLRALVMLGYGRDPRVQERLALAAQAQLPDGGWLCLHRLHKMHRVPKSCIKAAMHGLLLAAELRKRGLAMPGDRAIIQYFRMRRLFYRTDDSQRLVLDCRPGWRMVDLFHPIEVQRVGLATLLEALAALGVGPAPEFESAWALLESKRDPQDRVVLEGTLAKPYLPKERVGRPSKWNTLYAWLAWAAREPAETKAV